jgi:menaquinone-dependent protoporphyrinogen IX oxidase
MHAIVICESLTGNTLRAGEIIAAELERRGWDTSVCPTDDIDFGALSRAELVIVGTWTDGIFVIGQRPGGAGRLRSLPVLHGKKAVVFCTFALDPGKTLEKLVAIVEARGAEVVGGQSMRRDHLESSALEFVDRVMAAVPG